MWNFSAEDVASIKTTLVRRRISTEEELKRMEEELKRIDEEVAEVETFERTVADFRAKYGLGIAASSDAAQPDNAPPLPGSVAPASTAASSEPGEASSVNWGTVPLGPAMVAEATPPKSAITLYSRWSGGLAQKGD